MIGASEVGVGSVMVVVSCWTVQDVSVRREVGGGMNSMYRGCLACRCHSRRGAMITESALDERSDDPPLLSVLGLSVTRHSYNYSACYFMTTYHFMIIDFGDQPVSHLPWPLPLCTGHRTGKFDNHHHENV